MNDDDFQMNEIFNINSLWFDFSSKAKFADENLKHTIMWHESISNGIEPDMGQKAIVILIVFAECTVEYYIMFRHLSFTTYTTF